jgi:hypothetical protein
MKATKIIQKRINDITKKIIRTNDNQELKTLYAVRDNLYNVLRSVEILAKEV